MPILQQLENKIRQSIPDLKEEYEVFQEGAIDLDMITPVMLNHVLVYFEEIGWISVDNFGTISNLGKDFFYEHSWNLKSAYLKDQSQELITFLNQLKWEN